ncbi:MAG: hypothetical protein U9N83_07320 [Thermodesulfobacteriota bacterium]|nr:hypothetical protein [Thermodesulfobacteriota bacterium]
MQKNYFKIGIIIIILAWAVFLEDAETAASAEKPDFKVIIGEWVRPDGGYIIRVRDVNPDGSLDAGYFNPGKINIAEANVSLWKGLVKLFIKLQDKGYPGSTYTLYYYPEKVALAGFYYQAAVGQTYEVVFFRKKVE